MVPVKPEPKSNVKEIPEEGVLIVQDVLERIENHRLAEKGELNWSDHNQIYTEWNRQR